MPAEAKTFEPVTWFSLPRNLRRLLSAFHHDSTSCHDGIVTMATAFSWATCDERLLIHSGGLQTGVSTHNGNQVGLAEPILASGKHSWVIRIAESWQAGYVRRTQR